jgi:hypothetical protein
VVTPHPVDFLPLHSYTNLKMRAYVTKSSPKNFSNIPLLTMISNKTLVTEANQVTVETIINVVTVVTVVMFLLLDILHPLTT